MTKFKHFRSLPNPNLSDDKETAESGRDEAENGRDAAESGRDAAEGANTSERQANSDGPDGVVTDQPKRDSVSENVQQRDRKRRLPIIVAFPTQNRPRQPFMNQPTNQTTTTQTSPPTPPAYYANEVREDEHQPQRLREISCSRPREPSEPAAIQPDNVQHYQPRQSIFVPNTMINIAYWAPYPSQIPSNTPACLAHLVAADSLFIVQQIDVIELFMNIEEPNVYLIQNKYGQCIYYAYETSKLCAQLCCRHSRGFQLHIMDVYHNEIIYMNKPCGCNDYFCCYPAMEVYAPPLVPVGAIIKTFHATHDQFSIVDADENKIFKIHGPCSFWPCRCCVGSEFTIHALDSEETEVGVIRREFGGYVRALTNADFYGITFPKDLDVRIKAVFLGALFLIDYTFYEN